jgi:hypothetical protein
MGPEWENVHETRVPPRLNALESRFHHVQSGLAAVAGATRISQVTQVAGRPATRITTRENAQVAIHGNSIMG